MKFSELAAYFEKLEATSGRIELTNILSELFKNISAAEIDKVAYLLQGRVVPFFEPIEIGMADKMVDQAIASAYGVPREKVQKLLTQKGDMGLAAEELNGSKKDSSLTISDVHTRLHDIATTGGEGSVEKKINILADLLKKLDAKSAKHLVKITLSKLRLGIGDPTVLDALSAARIGDKSHRKDLEEAYNKTSDLGFIAETFWSKGIEAVKKIRLQVGKPVRPALAERLPDAEAVIKRVGSEFAVEPKYDGFRNQVHKKGGEAIAYNPATEEFLPFQETTKRRRKYAVEEFAQKLPLKLFAFDLLYLNGKDITSLSYKERRAKLAKIVSQQGQILVAKEEILHSAQDLAKMFEEQVTAGLEGVMIKKLDAPYKAGSRGFHWIKFKRAAAGELTDTVDCVLLGIYSGTGKRTEFGAGGLLVGLYEPKKDEFVTVSRIGTGLTDDEWRKVYEISQRIKVDHKPARVNALINPSYWTEPKEVLEIFADEITRSPVHTAGKVGDEPGYALRFPRLISFRGADKRPEDATTVKELVKMYEQQKKVKVR
jgi:DNA ligase-1